MDITCLILILIFGKAKFGDKADSATFNHAPLVEIHMICCTLPGMGISRPEVGLLDILQKQGLVAD